MRVCGQTLILIDNDITVSDLNRKIMQQTLKYMLYHSPESRAFCISTYGHELEGEEDYTTDLNDLLCKADLLEFKEKDSSLTDVLGSVLTNWKESDFACRDIVVFTDGLEGEELNYEKEELYYLINNTSYPIYVVYLVQDNNAEAKKSLSAIATTSEGKLFASEFPGDDAGVDKQIAEGIFEKMDEYAKREWSIYEQDEEEGIDANELTQQGKEDGATDDEIPVFEGEIIYDNVRTPGVFESPATLAFVLIFSLVIIILSLAGGMYVLKLRKKEAAEDKKICDMAAKHSYADSYKGSYADSFFEADSFEPAFFAEDGNVTRPLTDDGEEDSRTRLLTNTSKRIELTDINNNANSLSISVSDRVVLGRKRELCDICIPDDSVSKRHCEISLERDGLYITDQGSANGTFINGERVMRSKIRENDKVKIGRLSYVVRYL